MFEASSVITSIPETLVYTGLSWTFEAKPNLSQLQAGDDKLGQTLQTHLKQ
jgi:hypothetical protein